MIYKGDPSGSISKEACLLRACSSEVLTSPSPRTVKTTLELSLAWMWLKDVEVVVAADDDITLPRKSVPANPQSNPKCSS